MNKISEEKFVDSFLKDANGASFFVERPLVFEQVEMIGGIPDLLLIRRKQVKTLGGFMRRFPSIDLTNGHARVISILSKRIFLSPENIIARSGLTPLHFKKSISALENMAAIEKNRKGNYRLGKNFNLPKIELWSLEFKLSNWRSALRQSLRYRAFSSHVSVVMPSSKRNVLLKNKESFQRFEIGVATYDAKNKNLEFIVKPTRCGALSKRLYVDALGRITSRDSCKAL